MTADRMFCPRCGESLPRGFERCDACGAFLRDWAASPGGERGHGSGERGHEQQGHSERGHGERGHSERVHAARDRAHGPAPRPKGRGPVGQQVPGVAWLLLVVGLAVGGMVGYALRSSVGPRGEGGMATGPSDILAGSDAGVSVPMGGMPGEAGSPQGAMPTQVMEMIQSYKAALAKNPDDLSANIGLGNLQFDSGQWSKAIESYTHALKLDPTNADVRVDRAIAYHNLGQNSVAKAELLRVTKERPEHKNSWLNLGVVASQLGERLVAIQAWERYLQLNPSGEHAASIRAELENLKRAR